MADRASWVTDTGERIPVFASELRREDKGKIFECQGKYRGEECRARTIFVYSEQVASHFRAITEHCPNCKYDESSQFHIISKVDQTGYNTSVDRLAIKFGIDKKPKEKKVNQANATGNKLPGNGNTGKNNEKDNEEKEPLGVLCRPKNAKELSLVLLQAHEDDFYGDSRVGDVFIDDRSIDSFLERGFENGQIFVVLCSKTNLGVELRSESLDNTLVLRGPYTRNHPDILVKFKTTKSMWNKIIRKMEKGDRVAVIGRWYHHPERSDVIICEYVPAKCLAILKSKFFEE